MHVVIIQLDELRKSKLSRPEKIFNVIINQVIIPETISIKRTVVEIKKN